MRHDDKDRLLDAILADDDLAEFRRSSADQMLSAVRRSRRRRRGIRAVAVALLPLAVVFGLVLVRSPKPAKTLAHRPNPVPAAPRPTPSEHARVQIIDDDQLFALFPDRPIALIGPPGRQELVFIDRHPKISGRHL